MRLANAVGPSNAPLLCSNALRLWAGIEGSISQGVRSHGLRRARYGGQPKTQLQAKAIAAAINLVRIHQMLQRTQLGLSPRPKRPLSPFARLRPLLAAGCPDKISQQSRSYARESEVRCEKMGSTHVAVWKGSEDTASAGRDELI
jgi:hypothetical protein